MNPIIKKKKNPCTHLLAHVESVQEGEENVKMNELNNNNYNCKRVLIFGREK